MTLCMTAASLPTYLPGAEIATAEARIALGQEICEGYCAREFARATRAQHTYLDSARVLRLRAYPVTSITSVTLDGRTMTDWTLRSATGQLALASAVTGDVCVTYIGGWEATDVPECVKLAIALAIQVAEAAGDNAGQTIVSERLDGYSATYAYPATGKGGLERIAPAAAALLAPYRAQGG